MPPLVAQEAQPLENWDNQAEGDEVEGITGFDDCATACEKDKRCFQALYDGTSCRLGTKNFRMGDGRKPEDGKMWQSMWMKKRIASYW